MVLLMQVLNHTVQTVDPAGTCGPPQTAAPPCRLCPTNRSKRQVLRVGLAHGNMTEKKAATGTMKEKGTWTTPPTSGNLQTHPQAIVAGKNANALVLFMHSLISTVQTVVPAGACGPRAY